MKKAAATILGWAISVALIAALAARLDFRSLMAGLASAQWPYLAVAAAINFVVLALKALRWQLFMRPEHRARFSNIFRATVIGYAGNNVLPARGGEWYRIYLLGKTEGVSKAMLASVTGLDKLFDGLAILLLFGALSLHSRFPAWVQKGTAIVSVVIAVALAICILLLLHHRRTPSAQAGELGAISRLAKNLGSGMSMLASRNLVLATLAISVAICLLQVGTIWTCQRAFGQRLDLWIPALVYVAINLSIIIPSAPSGVGPFEVAAVLAYTWLGLQKETAFTIALLYHAVQFFPVTIAGCLFFFSIGHHPKREVPS